MAKNLIIDDKLSKQFGDDYIKIIIQELRSAGKNASGNLMRSFNDNIRDTASEVLIAIESLDYLEDVDQGRKPGSYPPLDAIKKWVSLKGISKEAAFPIAKSIYKFGIKPTNIIEKAERKMFASSAFKRLEDGMSDNTEELIYNELLKMKQ